MANSALMYRPETQQELLELLAEHRDTAALVSGGTAFTILRGFGLMQPDHVISVKGLPGLSGVTDRDGTLAIGALTSLREIEWSKSAQQQHPVLTNALKHVANARVRNVATLGGNLAEADPTSDPPGVLTALDAVITATNLNGERDIPIQEFHQDYFETSLRPDEFVTHVVVPALSETWGGTYLKFLSRSADDRTCIGVAAFVRLDTEDNCDEVRIAIVGAGPTPLRLPDIEQQFSGNPLNKQTMESIADEYASASDPISDIRGSADYRKRIMTTLIPEAIERASKQQNDAVKL